MFGGGNNPFFLPNPLILFDPFHKIHHDFCRRTRLTLLASIETAITCREGRSKELRESRIYCGSETDRVVAFDLFLRGRIFLF